MITVSENHAKSNRGGPLLYNQNVSLTVSQCPVQEEVSECEPREHHEQHVDGGDVVEGSLPDQLPTDLLAMVAVDVTEKAGVGTPLGGLQTVTLAAP